MSKLRWQRKFSALLDWFLLSGIVLVAFCSLLKSVEITTQVCSVSPSPSPPPIFTAANHSTQAVRHLSLPTRRYAFRHFRTWKKYALRHTISQAHIGCSEQFHANRHSRDDWKSGSGVSVHGKPLVYTGWRKKVSRYHESSLNRIKTRNWG